MSTTCAWSDMYLGLRAQKVSKIILIFGKRVRTKRCFTTDAEGERKVVRGKTKVSQDNRNGLYVTRFNLASSLEVVDTFVWRTCMWHGRTRAQAAFCGHRLSALAQTPYGSLLLTPTLQYNHSIFKLIKTATELNY